MNFYAVTDALGVPLPNFKIVEGWTQISFDAFINNAGENRFYIISNKPAIGTSDTYSRNVPTGSPEISDTAVPTANFTLTIGSTEALYGVSETLLKQEVSLPDYKGVSCQTGTAEEQEDKYNDLKTIWSYPKSKDFTTYYVEGSSPQYTIDKFHGICNQTQPYEQANVFVEEWATRMFTTANGKTGEINPIRMGVKVW